MILILKNNKKIAMSDVVNGNKTDSNFVAKLAKEVDITELLSYVGWNTEGNTLRFTIRHAVSRCSFMENTNIKSVKQLNQAGKSHY